MDSSQKLTTSSIMKKAVLLFFVAFVMVLAMSSCNQKTCPAYSKANVEQAEQNV